MKSPIKNSLAKNNDRGDRLAIRANDVAQAVLRKLQAPLIDTSKTSGLDSRTPAPNLLANAIQQTAMSVNDAKNIKQLLPDMELAKRILVNSILSPNDMMSRELTHQHEALLIGEVGGTLLDIVREHFETVYKIEVEMPRILERVLFDTGSYPVAVIPESSLDDLLSADGSGSKPSVESFASHFNEEGLPKSTRYLGDTTDGTKEHEPKITYESMYSVSEGEPDPWLLKNRDFNISVTDNPDVLKFPVLDERRRKSFEVRQLRSYSRAHVGLENYGRPFEEDKSASDELDKYYQKNRNAQFKPVTILKTREELDRPTIGEPMLMVLPSESVVTIFRPGKPDEIIGALAAVDMFGNFLRSTLNENFYNSFSGNNEQAKGMQSMLIAQTRRQTEGRKSTEADDQTNEMEMMQMFTELVERDFKTRFKNGVYGENVQIGKSTDMYRIMFHRFLQKQRTQVVFIPASMMTYFAFDYNEFGSGVSLIENTKILCSLRSMMLFANTTAAIKNSVHHVAMNVTLDEDDGNGIRTLEYIKNEYARNRRSALPYGRANPTDINNFLANAGVQLNVENHPAFPGTKVEIENMQTSVTPVDTELDESLKRRHLMALGIAPEVVEAAEAVDFATSIVSSNIMLAKIALEYQKTFCNHLSDHMRKYILGHGGLLEKMVKVVSDNKELLKKAKVSMSNTPMDIVEYFISKYSVLLPEPDLSRLELQMAEFDAYSEALDKVLPAFISSEMFPSDLMGEIGNSVDQAVSIIKAMLLRRHLQMNNILPEVFELLSPVDTSGSAFNLLQQHTQYMATLNTALDSFLKKTQAMREANDKKLEEEGITAVEGSGDTGGDDSGGGDDEGGDGSDGGGDDEFDFDAGGDGEDAAADAEAAPEAEEEAAPEEAADDKAAEKPAKDEAEE